MTEFTEPPVFDHLTHHARAHFKTYAHVLDGMAEGADPAELARVVLGVDIDRDPEWISALQGLSYAYCLDDGARLPRIGRIRTYVLAIAVRRGRFVALVHGG